MGITLLGNRPVTALYPPNSNEQFTGRGGWASEQKAAQEAQSKLVQTSPMPTLQAKMRDAVGLGEGAEAWCKGLKLEQAVWCRRVMLAMSSVGQWVGMCVLGDSEFAPGLSLSLSLSLSGLYG